MAVLNGKESKKGTTIFAKHQLACGTFYTSGFAKLPYKAFKGND